MQASIDESLALRRRWDGAANGRLRAAFAPRFAVSCSRELLEAVASLSIEQAALVHTHAAESRDELALVRRLLGRTGQYGVSRRDAPGVAAPVRRALHLGGRSRAGAPGRARREGDALSRLEPEARIGCRAGSRAARAGHHRLARRRRRGVQQPARHVRRDASRRPRPGRPAGAWRPARTRASCGWPRATARRRSDSTQRSARSSPASGRTSSSWTATGLHVTPSADPYAHARVLGSRERRPDDHRGR